MALAVTHDLTGGKIARREVGEPGFGALPQHRGIDGKRVAFPDDEATFRHGGDETREAGTVEADPFGIWMCRRDHLECSRDVRQDLARVGSHGLLQGQMRAAPLLKAQA
ncbi:hypothetical protein [Methylobacterium sp.]|uniref:hypothetical protein n=1 Tax=Methylobacterium sp. TaxID=409 RepID=UPI003B02CF0E